MSTGEPAGCKGSGDMHFADLLMACGSPSRGGSGRNADTSAEDGDVGCDAACRAANSEPLSGGVAGGVSGLAGHAVGVLGADCERAEGDAA